MKSTKRIIFSPNREIGNKESKILLQSQSLQNFNTSTVIDRTTNVSKQKIKHERGIGQATKSAYDMSLYSAKIETSTRKAKKMKNSNDNASILFKKDRKMRSPPRHII